MKIETDLKKLVINFITDSYMAVSAKTCLL